MIALGIATFAKVLDLVCNFLIPTPSITRNRDEQWEYEKLVAAKNEEGEENGEADHPIDEEEQLGELPMEETDEKA